MRLGFFIMTIRSLCIGAICVVAGSSPAVAQIVSRDVSPLNLPRPGYGYEGIQVGASTVLAQIDIRGQYDTNVYATAIDEISDNKLIVAPSISHEIARGRAVLRTEAHGEFLRYADETTENSDAYGAGMSFALNSTQAQRFTSNFSYNRAIESRADPERRLVSLDRPRKIDIFSGELRYNRPFGNFKLALTGGADRYDYLDPLESDRDMLSLRGAVRVAYKVTASYDLFVEGYWNRRNFADAVDLSGVDRDASTLGANIGVQSELGQRLRGRIGIGVFRSNPDSSSLDSFTGIGANGEIVWNPRTRTAVTLRLSRGDVATVRAGATGRVDTTVRLTVDQEVRHNILARVSVGYLDQAYRGSARGHLKTFATNGEIEYLVNRHTSLVAEASYAKRDAKNFFDQYEKALFSIGVRYKI
jgi:hypothetical protein